MARTKNTPAIDPAITAAIAQAVAAAIAQNTPEPTGVITGAEAHGELAELEALANAQGLTLVGAPANRTPAKPKPAAKPKRKPAAKPKPGVITCGTAWEALGADPEYAPKDPSKPATAPQLWRLNSEGLLPALLA